MRFAPVPALLLCTALLCVGCYDEVELEEQQAHAVTASGACSPRRCSRFS